MVIFSFAMATRVLRATGFTQLTSFEHDRSPSPAARGSSHLPLGA
jgi:hypothetical protein